MKKIKFVDSLPPAMAFTRKGSRYKDIASSLREKPGVWALVDEKLTAARAGGHSSYVRKALGDGFQVASRGKQVYARFVGDGSHG